MKDVICKCGHISNWHNDDGCAHSGCTCSVSYYQVLRDRLARQDAVIEATRHYINKEKGRWTWKMQLMIEALDALDSTK